MEVCFFGGVFGKSGFPSISMKSFPVFTFIPSFFISFLRAWMRSVSLILRFAILVILVFPSVNIASIANVIVSTRTVNTPIVNTIVISH